MATEKTKSAGELARLYKAIARTGRSKGLELDHHILAKIENGKLIRICRASSAGRSHDRLAKIEDPDTMVITFPVFKGTNGQTFPADEDVLNFLDHRTFLPP